MKRADYESELEKRIWFYCPGCSATMGIKEWHSIPVVGDGWQFNGDLEFPTLKPSILVNRGSVNNAVPVCHSYVTDGRIQYLNDCTHSMAGKTVELPEAIE